MCHENKRKQPETDVTRFNILESTTFRPEFFRSKMVDTRVKLSNDENPYQRVIREKKMHDPQWEARVRKRIYQRVSWSGAWKNEVNRRESKNRKPPERSLDEVFEKKVQKSVIGRFLDDAKIPANPDVREAMVEILEYDWRSFTVQQWKKFAAKNNFITNPLSCLARAILKNERINCRWLEAVATTLRLIASGITKIGRSLKRFKVLHNLSLGGNEIKIIEGQNLPSDLRVLELSGNRISTLEKLVNGAPKGLMFLGLSRNRISNEQELQSLAKTLHFLKVLDLEDNDLRKLEEILEALKPLEMLRALILEGNPCSTCLCYKNALFATFPNLIYLDNVVIKPSDKSMRKWKNEPDKMATGILFMHVYRIFHLEQPPKLKKEKFWYFFEVDLPLLDAHLILREELEMVREELAKTGIEFPVIDHRGSKQQAEDQNNPRVTCLRTEEFEWQESLFFNEPILEMPPYGDELKLLSDTFKSVVNVRLVRQKFPIDEKQKSESKINIDSNERTIVCEFTCALKNMSWADRSQDFSWTFEETRNNSAISCPPGILPRRRYIRDDLSRGGKSTKSLHKQLSFAQKESKIFEPLPFPKKFTIQIGFGLRRYPDFDPIEISLPIKRKK